MTPFPDQLNRRRKIGVRVVKEIMKDSNSEEHVDRSWEAIHNLHHELISNHVPCEVCTGPCFG